MGLSIHYSGDIRSKEFIDSLTEEVTDICKTLEWPIHLFNDDEIRGVCFSPKGGEPVFLTFNKDGRMLSPIIIQEKSVYNNLQLTEELVFSISTKTQYAGIDAHISIITLLKYISAKYLKNFTLIDEGCYWETGDVKILMNQFKKYNSAMNIFF